jgi:hypothetical protein
MRTLKDQLLRVIGCILYSFMILMVVVLLPIQVSSHTDVNPKEEIHDIDHHDRIVSLPEDS